MTAPIRFPSLFRLLALAVAVIALSVSASAKEKAPPKPADQPDQLNEADVLGEAHIGTKFQFVKFTYDDKKEWENHEYVDGSKTLIIKGIDRSQDHSVVLSPRESGYEPVVLTLKASDFKRTVLKTKGRTQTITFRAFYRPEFKKVEAPKADAKPKEGAEPAPK
ncbi:MAG: hypothetical protein FJ100_15940 [Deltaproteobacteria bacterium]|nr:hypothetical protein [Deltaproteobacteria bacterium]